MSRKLVTTNLAVSLFLALGLGFVYLQYRDAVNARRSAEDEANSRLGRIGELEEQLRDVEGKLDLSKKREGLLRERLQSEDDALVAEKLQAESSADEEDADKPKVERRPEPELDREVIPVAEAEAVAKDLMGKGDIEGLWRLGFDLLAQGEEGYEKLIELAEFFDENSERDKVISELWGDEDMFFDKFFSEAMRESGNVLRFGLYLQNRPEVGGLLGELRREIIDESGGIMLGAYGGDDSEILDGYGDLFRSQIRQEMERGGLNRSRDAILGLANINSIESTDFLAGLIGTAPKSFEELIIRSIAFHRTDHAASVLRRLQNMPIGQQHAKLLEAAIRLQRE